MRQRYVVRRAPGTTGHRGVLAVLCLALATVVSAVASLNVAIPSIARDTHATQTQLSWIVDAYGLTFAALLLLGGAIGDRYGRRRALVAGLAVFGGGAAAAMWVTSPGPLIVLRGVLGLGAALVMPATLSTITSTFPQDQRGKAVGTWAGIAGASAILGLLASGLVLEWWSWRSVFALNVILAVISVAGVMRRVPESADTNAPRLDMTGAALAVVGLGVLVYSIIEAPTAGWTAPRTVLGALAGLAVLAAFAGWEASRQHPLLDPRLFRNPSFAAGSLSMTMQFLAFFGFIFLILQYLQFVQGHSALIAAVSLLPMAIGMMPAARLAPQLSTRIGMRATMGGGLCVLICGFVIISRLGPDSSYWLLLIGLPLCGAGMGAAMTPATTVITDALPRAQQGVASAMNDLARELGGVLGIAVLGSVMQSRYRENLRLPAIPADLAEQIRTSPAAAIHVGGRVADQARSAFASGMSDALLVGAAGVVIALIAVLSLLRANRPSRPSSTGRSGAEPGRST